MTQNPKPKGWMKGENDRMKLPLNRMFELYW